jgi:hypothetical protein
VAVSLADGYTKELIEWVFGYSLNTHFIFGSVIGSGCGDCVNQDLQDDALSDVADGESHLGNKCSDVHIKRSLFFSASRLFRCIQPIVCASVVQ